jgi:hypothetical protein
MHGDAHPGNVYFRNGAAGLLDWQVVRRGHRVANWPTPGHEDDHADRQASERELLDSTGVLASTGGPASTATAMGPLPAGRPARARRSTITAGMGGMQTGNIALEGLRGVAARTTRHGLAPEKLCDRRSTIIKTND